MLTDFVCLNCGKECRKNSTNHRLLYCSNSCQKAHDSSKLFDRWMAGELSNLAAKTLRAYVIRRDGYQCSKCGCAGWRGEPITLEVDHIDGTSSDCSPENVRLLCPNCHSQTPTFRSRNNGNGRHVRRERIAAGLSY